MFRWLASLFGSGSSDTPEVAEAKRRMQLDHADPRKRFVWGVLAISTGSKADPAYLPAMATKALNEWYGMHSHDELLDNIAYYIEGTGSTPGYDAFRAVFMSRAGFGAGMLSEAESWDAAFRVIRKLKQSYPTWNHYGMGYIEGHLRYRGEQGDSSDAIAGYRRNLLEHFGKVANGIWAQTPYDTPV